MEGAVNVNTAPVEVLMTLPQMTEEVAQAIVDYRATTPFLSRGAILRIPAAGGNSSGGTGRNTPGQFAVSTALFNQIIEKVTVVSDSFTVRVLGVGQSVSAATGTPSDIAVHLTAVLDRSTGRCRIRRLRQDN
jgi:hypothetical protein